MKLKEQEDLKGNKLSISNMLHQCYDKSFWLHILFGVLLWTEASIPKPKAINLVTDALVQHYVECPVILKNSF